jgi:2-aminoadipate transaminase
MTTELTAPTPYAARAERFHPSPVRAVWDVSMRPGMISLAGGNPDLTSLPLEALAARAATLIAEQGLEVLQYGAGGGLDLLRDAVAEHVRHAGFEARTEEILITSGSQMGLELIATMLCDPGDVVLAEGPTYVGALTAFEGLEADVVHVECDADGLVPEQLEVTILRLHGEGRRIKLLYTIPNFGNPSGLLLQAERRPRIAELCAQHGITIVEDDPDGHVAFGDGAPPAIRSWDASVLYLGSMSKIFSPGLRVGWVVAPADLCARLQIAAEATTIHASVLSQHLAHAYLTEFDWRGHLATAIALYRARAEATLAALERWLPAGTSWTTPSGGFFVWVTLPEGIDAEALLADAIDEGVVYVPGTAFYADGGGARQLRLSFSLASPEQIDEGVQRLARALVRRR